MIIKSFLQIFTNTGKYKGFFPRTVSSPNATCISVLRDMQEKQPYIYDQVSFSTDPGKGFHNLLPTAFFNYFRFIDSSPAI